MKVKITKAGYLVQPSVPVILLLQHYFVRKFRNEIDTVSADKSLEDAEMWFRMKAELAGYLKSIDSEHSEYADFKYDPEIDEIVTAILKLEDKADSALWGVCDFDGKVTRRLSRISNDYDPDIYH